MTHFQALSKAVFRRTRKEQVIHDGERRLRDVIHGTPGV